MQPSHNSQPAKSTISLLLDQPVQPASAHALPFRIIFDELLRRRNELLDLVRQCQPPQPCQKPVDVLQELLTSQEKAYETLETESGRIQQGRRSEPLDNETAACQNCDAPLKEILHKMQSSALCLSGGGIRSASFGLGILQGLSRFSLQAKKPEESLMWKLDYLSTVSGGGYIGSWLMCWVWRRYSVSGGQNWPRAYREVVSALAGDAANSHVDPPMPALTAGDPEPSPLRHIRSFTSFLAPTLGFSGDTFTLVAIVLRNLLVNWVMLLPAIFAIIGLTRCSGLLFAFAEKHLPSVAGAPLLFGASAANLGIGLLITLCYFIAAAAAFGGLGSHEDAQRDSFRKKHAVGLLFAFTIIGSWLLTTWQDKISKFSFQTFGWKTLIAFIGFGVLGGRTFRMYKLRMLQAVPNSFVSSGLTEEGARENRKYLLVRAGAIILVAVLTAAVVTGGLLMLMRVYAYPRLLDCMPLSLRRQALPAGPWFIVLALPGVLLILMTAMTMFSALTGLLEPEEDREWWVRTGSLFLRFIVIWIVAHFLAFFGDPLYQSWIIVSGLAVGTAVSLVGFSSATSAGVHSIQQSQLRSVGKFLQKHNLILPAIGCAALALILLGLVSAEERLRGILIDRFGQAGSTTAQAGSTILLVIAASLVAVLLNLAININIFSLHGMYRMRLMRAFLGASNVQRKPDRFTNFDAADSPYESELPCSPGVPLHIVNATLNLTGTRNTAWRQRRAESFTFSAAHVGGWRVGYVPTSDYGGANGVKRATSMAISGAAVNPNMGYNSSPLLSLLMTFFNVRLGFWLPNPKRLLRPAHNVHNPRRFLRKPGPRFALKPLVAEAFGLADDTSAWIELSDGGHFEDLGLYEMVMRRCKQIIVIDAGADPRYFLDDLGNAIRKIHIDLGIPIELSPELNMFSGINLENRYCVTGTIRYSCVDKVPGMKEDEINGKIVYIKAGLTGLEPADILQYARTHPIFPHETTANQFFSESQFESYRHLGSFIIDQITGGNHPTFGERGTMQNFMELASAFHELDSLKKPKQSESSGLG